jgi:hypothetical protein
MADMTDEERQRRIAAKLLAEEAAPQPAWYWLSFIDPDRAQGTRFLGVAIVHADGHMSAIDRTHRLNINPGGEVACYRLPDDFVVAPEHRNKLLDRVAAARAKGEQ